MSTSTQHHPRPGTGPDPRLPVLVSGGMGVGVSSWRLASAVAASGQLGVVSGTALDTVLARRLQDGDLDGEVRRALAHFPMPAVADGVMRRWFRPQGRQGRPYLPVPRLALRQHQQRHAQQAEDLSVLGNFVEVWLAKDGHDGLVGVNYLEKIQMATAPAVYGAMLAGVDAVLMGAGIPREVPGLLDALARGEEGHVGVDVAGAGTEQVAFDPIGFAAAAGAAIPPRVRRPWFLAIVSSHVLAQYLCREDSTRPDGFVVEGPRAGGHNAPPRGRLQLDDAGEPVYGPRDDADLTALARLGLPFWLAGGYGEPERVVEALAAGAAGVQVGTLFALCRESGLTDPLREDLLARVRAGTLDVRTDPAASPTGFPFKVAQLPGTLSDPATYERRPRLCDLGYLRQPYLRSVGDDGSVSVGYRCPAEPVDVYVRKGGDVADTVGAVCLCNALMTDVGIGQERRDGYVEPPLVTLGADLAGVTRLDSEHWLHGGSTDGWTAAEAVSWLLRLVGRSECEPVGTNLDDEPLALPVS